MRSSKGEKKFEVVVAEEGKQEGRDERGEIFFFQAGDGIRDAQEARGLGDVYKRQDEGCNGIRTGTDIGLCCGYKKSR